MPDERTGPLRVAVVGAGAMGTDHIERLHRRIRGVRVAAVVEPAPDRAARAVALAPGAEARASLEESIDRDALDGVLVATPGQFHEPIVITALEAGLAIFCEKPMTMDSPAALRILQAEERSGKRRIQVGFMRRYDAEYQHLRAETEAGRLGALLAVHAFHRAPEVPESWTREMLATDAAAHEIDVIPWLAGSDLESVEAISVRASSHSPIGDPLILVLRLVNGTVAIVELNVHARFGYQVRTEAVFEEGVMEIGRASGPVLWHAASASVTEHTSFVTRFAPAYDRQIQQWVDGAAEGRVDGPTAWDGYRAAIGTEAAVRALMQSGRVGLESIPRPAFYR